MCLVYCKGALTSLPQKSINWLQLVQNSAARLERGEITPHLFESLCTDFTVNF